MAKCAEPMTESQFAEWLRALAEWPEVDEVRLAGSRGFGYARPDSDWDVVVCLADGAYHDPERGADLERRIAFAPGLRSEAVDLFFLTPPLGVLRRWAWGTPEDLGKLLTGTDAWEAGHILEGEPMGDFEALYRSLSEAKVVFLRDGVNHAAT